MDAKFHVVDRPSNAFHSRETGIPASDGHQSVPTWPTLSRSSWTQNTLQTGARNTNSQKTIMHANDHEDSFLHSTIQNNQLPPTTSETNSSSMRSLFVLVHFTTSLLNDFHPSVSKGKTRLTQHSIMQQITGSGASDTILYHLAAPLCLAFVWACRAFSLLKVLRKKQHQEIHRLRTWIHKLTCLLSRQQKGMGELTWGRTCTQQTHRIWVTSHWLRGSCPPSLLGVEWPHGQPPSCHLQ
jgi:hypothetical protein